MTNIKNSLTDSLANLMNIRQSTAYGLANLLIGAVKESIEADEIKTLTLDCEACRAAKREITTETTTKGYTDEQWDLIASGQFLCVFSDIAKPTNLGTIRSIYREGPEDDSYYADNGNHYRHCRPAKIKGCMRPWFVKPVNDEVECLFFGYDNRPLNHGVSVRYDCDTVKCRAKSYIEL